MRASEGNNEPNGTASLAAGNKKTGTVRRHSAEASPSHNKPHTKRMTDTHAPVFHSRHGSFARHKALYAAMTYPRTSRVVDEHDPIETCTYTCSDHNVPALYSCQKYATHTMHMDRCRRRRRMQCRPSSDRRVFVVSLSPFFCGPVQPFLVVG